MYYPLLTTVLLVMFVKVGAGLQLKLDDVCLSLDDNTLCIVY